MHNERQKLIIRDVVPARGAIRVPKRPAGGMINYQTNSYQAPVDSALDNVDPLSDSIMALERESSAPTPKPVFATAGASNAQTMAIGSDQLISGVRYVWVKYFLPIVVLALIAFGVWAIWLTVRSNIEVNNQISNYAKTTESGGTGTSADVGSSGKAGATSASGVGSVNNTTDPRQPKKVIITSLNVSATVLETGLTKDGHIAAPANIYDVSWYDGSSSPADRIGSALLVGHVGTDRLPGVFHNLHKINLGDTITVIMGDNTTHVYTVTSTEDVPEKNINMEKYLSYLNATKRQLRLITCTGDYDAKTYSFDNRLVVLAEENTRAN